MPAVVGCVPVAWRPSFSLSEHTLEGWLEGYILSGRHGLIQRAAQLAEIAGAAGILNGAHVAPDILSIAFAH